MNYIEIPKMSKNTNIIQSVDILNREDRHIRITIIPPVTDFPYFRVFDRRNRLRYTARTYSEAKTYAIINLVEEKPLPDRHTIVETSQRALKNIFMATPVENATDKSNEEPCVFKWNKDTKNQWTLLFTGKSGTLYSAYVTIDNPNASWPFTANLRNCSTNTHIFKKLQYPHARTARLEIEAKITKLEQLTTDDLTPLQRELKIAMTKN